MGEFKVGDRVSGKSNVDVKFTEGIVESTDSDVVDEVLVKITKICPGHFGKHQHCYVSDLKHLAPGFTAGQTVTGDDIRRALEDGWVLEEETNGWEGYPSEGNVIWKKGGHKCSFDAFLQSNAGQTYTLQRRKDEPKSGVPGEPANMGKPADSQWTPEQIKALSKCPPAAYGKRTLERPFLPGDVIRDTREDNERHIFKGWAACKDQGLVDVGGDCCKTCPGHMVTDKEEGCWIGGPDDKSLFKLVTPVEEKEHRHPELTLDGYAEIKKAVKKYDLIPMSPFSTYQKTLMEDVYEQIAKTLQIPPGSIAGLDVGAGKDYTHFGMWHQDAHGNLKFIKDYPLNQGAKMDPKEIKKPTNALERAGCKEAREETVKAAVEAEKQNYLRGTRAWIAKKKQIRALREEANAIEKEADELGEKLEITPDVAKQILG